MPWKIILFITGFRFYPESGGVMFRFYFVVFSIVFLSGVMGCSEERLPSDIPSNEGPISLTGGAV